MENKNKKDNNEPRTFYEWFFRTFSVNLSSDIGWNIKPIEGTRGYRVTGFSEVKDLNGEYYPGIKGEYKRYEIQKPDKKASKAGNNSRRNKSRGNNSKGNKSRENGRV